MDEGVEISRSVRIKPVMKSDFIRKRVMLLFALTVGALVWWPLVHLLFKPRSGGLPPLTGLSITARELAARHVHLWSDSELRLHELERMRRTNAEWDFMGRSFLVWSLAEMSLREPASGAANRLIMDQIIAETFKIEADRGQTAFLMPYARANPYKVQPARSLFVDGEIALMVGLRRLIGDSEDLKRVMVERVQVIESRMRSSSVLAVESYPDECWLF